MSIHSCNGPRRVVSVWILAAIAAVLPSLSQAQQTTIDYTGRLMGYYRIEPGVPIWKPDGMPSDALLPPVKEFLTWRKKHAETILVGMGDNFGPEFGASIQQEYAGKECAQEIKRKNEIAPENQYKDGDRIALSAECDNVVRFLLASGFRAIVPGREDFMYTSAWLQGIAHELKKNTWRPKYSPIPDGNDHKLTLLAANLRVATGKKKCPLLFADNPYTKDATNCTDDDQPEAVDWLDRTDKLLNDPHAQANILHQITYCADAAGANDCSRNLELVKETRATLVGNEVRLMFGAWRYLFTASEVDGFLNKDFGTLLQEMSGNPAKLTELLNKFPNAQPDKSYSASIDQRCSQGEQAEIKKQGELGWYRSVVEAELRAYSQSSKASGFMPSTLMVPPCALVLARAALRREIAEEEKDIGYTIAGTAPNEVLLIGVVGQETMQSISVINASLCKTPASVPPVTPSPFPFSPCAESKKQKRDVKVFDPVSSVVSILDGVGATKGRFQSIVLMAQMPQSEAVELGARIRGQLMEKNRRPLGLKSAERTLAPINVILCEPQQNHSTLEITLTYNPEESTPTLTSQSNYVATVATAVEEDKSRPLLPGSVSEAVLTSSRLENKISHAPFRSEKGESAWALLMKKLASSADAHYSCVGDSRPCRAETVLAVLQAMQRAKGNPSDVVLLERRDLFLETLPARYDDYDLCEQKEPKALTDAQKKKCELHIALDRVLWKGDYFVQVAVTGKNLSTILKTSEEQQKQLSSLITRDISQEWLVAYGVVQGPLSNLTNLGAGEDPLWLPQDPVCKAIREEQATPYCVNGRPIADDQLYWVTTTDQFAEENPTYKVKWELDPDDTKHKFLTGQIADALLGGRKGPGLTETLAVGQVDLPSESVVAVANRSFQQSSLFQVDFSKLIFSYSSSSPVGGDLAAEQFQGAADPRAAVPHKEEFDLEEATRVLYDMPQKVPFTVGVVSAGAYDRSVQGNLTGKPESVSYPQNSFSVGGFLQFRIPDRSTRSLPRNLIVLTPHQYQQQINNQRIFLPFTVGTGQLVIPLPRTTSFTDRAGVRREWGATKNLLNLSSGSYFEGGMEFVLQNNVLRSLTLTNNGGATSFTCTVSGSQSLTACFAGAKATFPIGPPTQLVGKPDVETLHTPGAYWNAHFERKYGSGGTQVTIVTESAAEILFGRPASAVLPTQTNYAIPWSVSLIFPLWGNLSIAPTYNAFFYRGQLSDSHLHVNSYAIALRWYFARDERVPIRRQSGLSGPISADQTKTGKSK